MNKEIFNYICCPNCHGDIEIFKDQYRCSKCQRGYPLINEIPDFVVEVRENRIDSISTTNTLFFDLTAHHYGDDYSSPPKAIRFLLRNFIEKESINNPYSRKRASEILAKYYDGKGLFLDVGCGTGDLLQLLGPKNDKALGIDISHQMLEEAKKKKLSCIRANNYKIPFIDNTFDMISAFSVIHHMVDLEMFFKEIFRVLKKGAVLYTDCDPNPIALAIKDRHGLYKTISAFIRNMLKRDYYGLYQSTGIKMEDVEYHLLRAGNSGYNMNSLESIWSRIGFEKIGIYYHSNAASIFQRGFFNENFINSFRKYFLHLLDSATEINSCGEYVLTLLRK